MTRKADEASRSQLLDRVMEYAFAHGVATLSLRPLATKLGLSAGSLLYHFHSKEELTVAILQHAGDRQRELFGALRLADDATPQTVCQNVWAALAVPEARPLFRLFFEVYGIALVDRARFPAFFPAAITNWLDFLEQPFMRNGLSAEDARIHATVVLAGFRGFLLDLCATEDDARVNAAVDAWIETLQ